MESVCRRRISFRVQPPEPSRPDAAHTQTSNYGCTLTYVFLPHTYNHLHVQHIKMSSVTKM